MIVDRDVQELGSDALDAVATVAGHPMRRPLDTHQPLDIEVQHVTRMWMFVAVGRPLWFDIADAAQLQTAQRTADRGATQTELLADPHSGPTLTPKLFDLHDPLLRRAARRTVRTRTAVLQPGHAMIPVTPDPLGHCLPAELELGLGLLQAQPALQNSLRKLLSTNNRQSSMMVIVHSVSSVAVASQLQLPSSRSNGQQPIETSHLAAPLVAATRAEYERRLAAQTEAVAAEKLAMSAQQQANERRATELAAAAESQQEQIARAVQEQVREQVQQQLSRDRKTIADEESARARQQVDDELKAQKTNLERQTRRIETLTRKLTAAQAAEADVLKKEQELGDQEREFALNLQKGIAAG